MLEFLKRRLKNEKGAMDKILVTLLLVVVGVTATIGLSTWVDTQSSSIQETAETQISSATTSNATSTDSTTTDTTTTE